MSKMKSPKHRQVRTGLKGSHRKPRRTRTPYHARRPRPWWYCGTATLVVLVAWVGAVAILTVYC